MRATEVMTTPFISVGPELSVKAAALVLLDHRIAAAPVLDHGTLIGMVSELDLLWGDVIADPRAHLTPVTQQPGGARTVADVMTRDVVALPIDTDTADLLTHMRSANVRSVPIVEGDRVVGIVARRDLLRSFVRADAEILGELRIRLRDALTDGDCWGLRVDAGIAWLRPLDGSSPDQALALAVASAVPGVLHARIEPSPPDPAVRTTPQPPR